MEKINLADLSSNDPKIKYGCAKNLLVAAKENPAEIYPHLDFFVKLLDSENRILKWTAIDIIGYLASETRLIKSSGLGTCCMAGSRYLLFIS